MSMPWRRLDRTLSKKNWSKIIDQITSIELIEDKYINLILEFQLTNYQKYCSIDSVFALQSNWRERRWFVFDEYAEICAHNRDLWVLRCVRWEQSFDRSNSIINLNHKFIVFRSPEEFSMDVVILISGIAESIKSYIQVENMSQLGSFDDFVKKLIAYSRPNEFLKEIGGLSESEKTIVKANIE